MRAFYNCCRYFSIPSLKSIIKLNAIILIYFLLLTLKKGVVVQEIDIANLF